MTSKWSWLENSIKIKSNIFNVGNAFSVTMSINVKGFFW